jgi:hypothetical protein
MSEKPQYTHRQVDDLLGEIIQLQAQLDAAIEVADRQRERAKQAEFLANERAKALTLVKKEVREWRMWYNATQPSPQFGIEVGKARDATNEARALEQP